MSAPRHARAAVFLCAVTILAAGAWAYSTSFAGVFVYDDGLSIVDNPHVKALWPLTRALTAPAEATLSGRPVASLSFALNYAFAPGDVRDVMTPGGAADGYARNLWGYHLVNLAIHLAAALALFGVVRRTLNQRALVERYKAAATPLAFATALVWVVHPLNTEAVTYIVQRVESLMGLFYLLTLYCAIRATDPGWASRWWTVGAVAACALGIGSKEVMVSAPVLVWLWDYVFGVDRTRRRPLYAGLAATWVILAVLVFSETRPRSVGFSLGWSPWAYLETQAAVVVHYLGMAIVPSPLVFDYAWPRAESFVAVAPQAALLAALFVASAFAVAHRRPIGLPGIWFFAILAPTSSVLPITTEVAAEHRMYLPVAAVIVVAVVGLYELCQYVAARVRPGHHSISTVPLVTSIGVAILVAGTFAASTLARNRDYWSDERIWMDTIEKRPGNARARVGYAANLQMASRFSEAEAQLRISIRLDDANALAHMNLGAVLSAQGRLDEGLAHLERAQALDSTIPQTYGLLGQAYSERGDYARAIAHLSRAIEMMPEQPLVLNRLAWLLATAPDPRLRDGSRAADLAARAVRLSHGQSAVFLETLGAAYAEQQRFGDAATALQQAVAIARAQHDEAAAAELELRLARYEAGRK